MTSINATIVTVYVTEFRGEVHRGQVRKQLQETNIDCGGCDPAGGFGRSAHRGVLGLPWSQ